MLFTPKLLAKLDTESPRVSRKTQVVESIASVRRTLSSVDRFLCCALAAITRATASVGLRSAEDGCALRARTVSKSDVEVAHMHESQRR